MTMLMPISKMLALRNQYAKNGSPNPYMTLRGRIDDRTLRDETRHRVLAGDGLKWIEVAGSLSIWQRSNSGSPLTRPEIT